MNIIRWPETGLQMNNNVALCGYWLPTNSTTFYFIHKGAFCSDIFKAHIGFSTMQLLEISNSFGYIT